MDIKALDFFSLNMYRELISFRSFAEFFLGAGFWMAYMALQNGATTRKIQHSVPEKLLLTSMFILPKKLEIYTSMWNILIFKFCN